MNIFSRIKRNVVYAITGMIVLSILFYLAFLQKEIVSHPLIESSDWVLASDSVAFSGRSGHTCAVFRNRLWVIGGWDGRKVLNDIWFTDDGINWHCASKNASFTGRAGHSMIVFNGKIWIIGGLRFNNEMNITDLNDVWYSYDGLKWNCATQHARFSPRGGHSSVVFDNKMWVVGGIACNADMWYSYNGSKWIRSIENAEFNSRGGHATVVFDNKMWVIGGVYVDQENNFRSLSDVWLSGDGKNWKKVVEQTSFFAGGGHTCIEYNKRIWIIGGFRKSGSIFTSRDGMDWEMTDIAADFGERVTHSCVVFKDKIWVIGGYNGKSYKNDIWFYQSYHKVKNK